LCLEHGLIFQLRSVTKRFPGRSCQQTKTIKVCHPLTPFLARPEPATNQGWSKRGLPLFQALVARRGSGSRKVRMPSNGPGCPVTTLWTTRCGCGRSCWLQSGQLFEAGDSTASGSSLDVDDVAGEIDQDRCEGHASFPEDSLRDGRSGGSAKVVPDHFGTDWAAEIGNCDDRMKADHVKTSSITEVVSSHSGENGRWSTKSRQNTSRAAESVTVDIQKPCKSRIQEENEQHYRKCPTPVGARSPMGNPE